MSKHLNDHSYEVTYGGSSELKTVNMRTVQLDTTDDYGAVRVLSMMDDPASSRHHRHEAKLTTVHFGSNSSTTYNIDEIREVLAEYDAWQTELIASGNKQFLEEYNRLVHDTLKK